MQRRHPEQPDPAGGIRCRGRKSGVLRSVTDLFALPFNHHPVVEQGLRAEEAQALLQAFFVRLREQRASRPRWKPPVRE